MGLGAGAGATQGVLGNTGTSSDGERRRVADGGARVPEVLPAAELEGFVARVGAGPSPGNSFIFSPDNDLGWGFHRESVLFTTLMYW